jgi:acetoacetyl-[acyl-carrier protein] synthase
MVRLPVIVGFGGINAAGRASFHHAYRRMVIGGLPAQAADATFADLATLMRLPAGNSSALREQILGNTLVRRIGADLFDVNGIGWNKRMQVAGNDGAPLVFVTKANQLPDVIPPDWKVTTLPDRDVRVEIAQPLDVMLPTSRVSPVSSAGVLPTGFDPGTLYQSRNHPRGLQMTIYGASDALYSTGIDWETIQKYVAPDQISVYAGSAMAQLDANGYGGMIMSRLAGKRVTSKHCPLGFAEMPADFINAYILGSIGSTGTSMGACASFLYNVRMGLLDIQTGRARVVIVGNSEAPVTPEIMDGYAAMGALATDEDLLALDAHKGATVADNRRAVRPFSTNCGFTLAESAQFIVLFDDALAVELGATIHGAIADVFVNADGHKKSISAPGVGNYLTMAKATACARALVGEKSLRQRSIVQAHGTSTPQNRVTESHILNETAKAFGIPKWLTGAVKAYVGHSIGAAAGDQITATLGLWQYGLMPGIATIDHIAEDVHHSNLNITPAHTEVGAQGVDVAIINSKGFGGNNASATLLAPHVVQRMLEQRHGKERMRAHQMAQQKVAATAHAYDAASIAGKAAPIYKFDHHVLDGNSVKMDGATLTIDGVQHKIPLNVTTPYDDLVL